MGGGCVRLMCGEEAADKNGNREMGTWPCHPTCMIPPKNCPSLEDLSW